jgi:uncharacterized protein YhfF
MDEFWQAYLDTLLPGSPLPERYPSFYLGANSDLAGRLGALVRDGTKTATCGLLWEYEAEGERLPAPGQRSILTTFEGQPLCIVEISDVLVQPFDAVDEQFAYEEGEGDRSLAYWRRAHTDFFTPICAALGRELSDDTPLVCERFRVIFPEPPRPQDATRG